MKLKTLSSLILTATLSTAAFAQPVAKDPSEMKWSGSIGLSNSTLDSSAADENLVGDQMQSLEFAFHYNQANVIAGAGFGLLIFDDQSDESYLVQDTSGDIESRDADANGFNFFFEGGYRHNIDKINLDFLVGVQSISAERSVSNCSDCPTADLELDGGMYIKPRLNYAYNPTHMLEVGYSQYLSGDIQNTLLLTWGSKF